MSRRYTYATTISFGTDGEPDYRELDIEVSYTVAWGQPESGRFGPPEHYDPGSGDVVEDIRVETVESLERPWRLHPGGDDALAAEIIAKLEMDHEQEMLAEAAEAEAGAYEDAMERRAEELREERF